MAYRTEILTPAAEPPVTLAEIKAHARMAMDLDDDDASIMAYVRAATAYVERRCARRLVTTTLRTTFDAWPCIGRPLSLPWAPVASVERLAHVVDGEPVDVDPADYVATPGTPGAVVATAYYAGPVVVDYTVGYGDPEDVPAEAKLPVMVLAAHWYARREPVIAGAVVSETPYHVVDLIGGLRWGAYPL